MAIDHLVFDKLKWFNFNPDAESQTLADKQVYTAPSKVKVTVPAGHSSSISVGSIGKEYPEIYVGTYDVIGAGNGYYIIKADGFYSGGRFANSDCIVEKKYCTPIWGGKTYLIHVWHAFKSFFLAREVA